MTISLFAKVRCGALAAAPLVALAGAADAAIDIVAAERGAGLTLAFSGTLNTLGLDRFDAGARDDSGIHNAPPFVSSMWFGSADASDFFYGLSYGGPAHWSTETYQFTTDDFSGDLFSFVLNAGSPGSVGFYLPVGYASGSSLAGSATYAGLGVADLHLQAPWQEWTLGNGDTVRLRVEGAVAVPEIGAAGGVAALVLVSGAFAVMAGRRRREV